MFLLFAGGYAIKKVRQVYTVSMVTCMIRPEQLNQVTQAVKDEDLMLGMTVLNVRGFGRQWGHRKSDSPDDDQPIRFLPKLKLEILVRRKDSNRMVKAIVQALHTGEFGDGKIVVYKAVHLMRIRTGEKGISAL